MPDSTPPKPQTREIASIVGYGRDITRAYLGPLLLPQDKVLARKWYDYEIYEDLLRDDQVKSVFQQRRSAVVAREWEVTPGGDKRIDKQAADFIRDTLGRMGWDNVSDKMLFGVFYGYAIGECMWAREGDKIQLTTIKIRKQRRFKFDWDMKPRLITWDNNYEGEALPEYKFWHYSTGADNDDDPYGLGLAHWLYWPTYFKRNGIKSWLKFLERFAQPTAKGTYGPGAEAAEKAALKQALQAFGEDAAVMVPEGVAIELIEAARSGTADYGGLCDRMDGAIAKIILSQTMTTDNGSSKSQAEVHNGVKLDVIKADADLIDASANNTWVKWLTNWNFPGAAYPRIGRKLEDEENLNDRAARDKSLSEMGFRLTPEKVVEVYGEGYFDPASLAEEGGEQPPLVSVLGVGGTEALVGFLTALSQMSLKRENAIATLTTVFGISRADAEAMVPEDAAPVEAGPPPSIYDAAALFSETPPDLLKALEPIGQQFADALNPTLFGVLQSLDRAAGDGEFAESVEDAAIWRRFVEVLEFGDRPNDRAFAVLQVLDQSVEVDMLTFAETESNVAMEGAIGRRLLALIRPGVVDFASGGGKKCTKGLSCGGSCISKAKVCVKALNPVQKQQYQSILKSVKAGQEGADKAKVNFKAALKSDVSDTEKESIAAKADAVKAGSKPDKAKDAKALSASELSAAEKSRFGKRIETLDYENAGDLALRDGIFHMAEVRGKGEDLAGASASMDRVQELDRLRGKKTLSDSDADEAAISMRQSIRGPNGSPINKASAVLGQQVYDRLSDEQKNLFAKKFGETDVSNIQMDDFVRDSQIVQDVAKRRAAAAKPRAPKESTPPQSKEPEKDLTQDEIDSMFNF
jgi:Protein of unknown function (DUF935)